jgi:hypothetical protein
MTSKWFKIDHGLPQDHVQGPRLCLLHINDPPQIINNTCVPVLFTDDNSILFMHNKTDSLNTNMSYTLKGKNKRFTANLL